MEQRLAPDYPIETARLLLRPIDPVGDVDAIADYLVREDVRAYIPIETATHAQVALRYRDPKRSRSVLTEPGQALALAVVRRDTGELIGDVLLMWNERAQAEIGYVFHPDHGGRGYATEAARVMLRLGFEGLGLHRVIGRLDGRNTASARVLERLGMRREAHLVQNEIVKGEWTDELVYAMLEQEWRDAVTAATP
jgi:RimJ/RimL family protein N-acetyltransferase